MDGRFVNSVPSNKLAPGSFFAMLRHQLFGNEERVPRRERVLAAARAAGAALVVPRPGAFVEPALVGLAPGIQTLDPWWR